MAKERADLGFNDPLGDFDPADWKPPDPKASTKRAAPEEAALIAKASGFNSREPGTASTETPTNQNRAGGSVVRRRRTGRNAQLNLKAKPETIEAYYALADAQGWGLGETLEYAVELLGREYGRSETTKP